MDPDAPEFRPSDPAVPRFPGESDREYAARLDAWSRGSLAAGYAPPPQVGMPGPFPGAASPRFLAVSGANPRTWDGLPPPVAVPAIPATESAFNPTLRVLQASPFPGADLVGIGPLPVGVPSAWAPTAPAALPFAEPSGSIDPGLREPFGDTGPARPRDPAFAATGFDRTWGAPPPMNGMYAGLVWSPERLLFEPGASLPSQHWYRGLTREGVYVQAYQDDETEPGVWKYRYIRSRGGFPDPAAPYEVLGALSDLYREQEIRAYEATMKAAEERIRVAKQFDNSWLSRVQRGEVVSLAEEERFVVPEKFKRMEIKREAELLPMPFWSAISKASVEKMYRDAGLPAPAMPGEAAVANNAAFQHFKEVRGHDEKSDPFFFPAEEVWDAQEAARRDRIKKSREEDEARARDAAASRYAPVPNVSGMTEKRAKDAIEEAGFAFHATGNTTGVARAMSQRPAAGDEARVGATVEVRFLGENDAGLPPRPTK